jgi:uncharacterized repeat protein (TIGR02543 family)
MRKEKREKRRKKIVKMGRSHAFFILYFSFILMLITFAGCTNSFMEKALYPTIMYTLTFESNGGTTVESQRVVEGEAGIRPRNPIKEGQGLMNWFSDKDLTKRYYFTDPVNADITLYAKYSTPRFTVNFNSMGGTPVEPEIVGAGGTTSGRPIELKESPTLTPEFTPTLPQTFTEKSAKTGYFFYRWYSDNDLTKAWDTERDAVNQDITLYAGWTPITYTVAYNANGGSGTMGNSTHTYDDYANLNRNTFTRTGYNIAGWAMSAGGPLVYSDGQRVINLEAKQDATVTLYAVWAPISYMVRYDKNNDDATGDMPGSIHFYDIRSNLSPNTFTLTEYAFDGWATSPEGPKVYSNGQSVTNLASTQGAIVTLYAKWVDSFFTVSFNINGGSGSTPGSLRVGNGSNTVLPDGAGFSRAGYTLTGWNTNSSGTGNSFAPGSNYTPSGNITLYAQWAPNTITISIDSFDQTSLPGGTIYRFGAPFILGINLSSLLGSYDSYEWYLDGASTPFSTSPSVSLNANDYPPGTHILSVVVRKGNYRYSKNIEFTIQ